MPKVISRSSIRSGLRQAAAWGACAVVAGLVMVACNDTVAPRPAGPAIRIVPVADSVFEGDTVHLAAQVFDEAGAADTTAPVAWSVSDTTLAHVVGEATLVLLRPGVVRVTARSGPVSAEYALVIGRLVVTRVEVTPDTIAMGRTDHLPVTVRALGPGGRVVTGRTVTITSDDTLVVVVPGPASIPSTDTVLLIAVGRGSTTIRASVEGVTGTASVGVVDADTTFALTDYEGSPLPVLVETDSVSADGEVQLFEIYADSGTLVLSGLLQERYQLDVEYAGYRVIQSGGTVRRELVARIRGQFDRGLVTVAANGSLSMVSEIIGPRLEHTAAPGPDGYLVHYRIPGEDTFLDLEYRRVTP
jgi:hypothetical protein